MNDLDLCLEVAWRSCQPPLRYIRRWIYRKKISRIKAWFQRTTNRKWHMGYQMVTWPMTSRDPQRCCEAVRSAILATAWLLVFLAFIQFASASTTKAAVSISMLGWSANHDLCLSVISTGILTTFHRLSHSISFTKQFSCSFTIKQVSRHCTASSTWNKSPTTVTVKPYFSCILICQLWLHFNLAFFSGWTLCKV